MHSSLPFLRYGLPGDGRETHADGDREGVGRRLGRDRSPQTPRTWLPYHRRSGGLVQGALRGRLAMPVALAGTVGSANGEGTACGPACLCRAQANQTAVPGWSATDPRGSGIRSSMFRSYPHLVTHQVPPSATGMRRQAHHTARVPGIRESGRPV